MKPLLLVLALLAPQVLAPTLAHAQAPQVLEAAPEDALKYLQAARAAFVPYNNEPLAPPEMRRAVQQNAAVFPLIERTVALPLKFESKNFSGVTDHHEMMAAVRAMARDGAPARAACPRAST